MNRLPLYMVVAAVLVALTTSTGYAQTGMMGGQGGGGHMNGARNGQGYAGNGQGYGPGYMMNGPGYGPGYMMNGQGYGPGYMMNGPGYYQASPEQQAAYQEVYGKYGPKFEKASEAMWAKRAELDALLAQPKVDRKKALALANEIGDLSAEACRTNIEMLVDLREKGVPFYGMGMMHGGMMGGYGMMGYGMGGYGMMGGYGQGMMRGYGGWR